MNYVIVAGDRDYIDYDHVRAKMNALWDAIGPFELISGNARGVDTVSGNIAADAGITIHDYPADWDKHDKGAGPIRNKAMLNHPATYLLAFLSPTSRGTQNMVDQAHKANLPITIVSIDRDHGKWAYKTRS